MGRLMASAQDVAQPPEEAAAEAQHVAVAAAAQHAAVAAEEAGARHAEVAAEEAPTDAELEAAEAQHAVAAAAPGASVPAGEERLVASAAPERPWRAAVRPSAAASVSRRDLILLWLVPPRSGRFARARRSLQTASL
jgi:hypothetical protein